MFNKKNVESSQFTHKHVHIQLLNKQKHKSQIKKKKSAATKSFSLIYRISWQNDTSFVTSVNAPQVPNAFFRSSKTGKCKPL